MIAGERASVGGLPVTRPSRTTVDLLATHEEPETVGHVITDTLRGGHDDPPTIAVALAPYAARYGFRRGDGVALLGWLLDLAGDPARRAWMEKAREQISAGEAG